MEDILSWFYSHNIKQKENEKLNDILSLEDIKSRLFNIKNKFKYIKGIEREILIKCYDSYYENYNNRTLSEKLKREIKDDSSIWSETGLQFDLTMNSFEQFGQTINNPFFINSDKNAILISNLCIYTVLYLSEKESTWNDEYNKKLSDFLSNPDNQLKYFNLNCWTLSENNMIELSNSLALNTNLKNLNLSGNSIGDMGMKALSSYLIENKTLTKLNISNNGIGEIGLTYLAAALLINRTLKDLTLGDDSYSNPNCFTKQSLDKLSISLKENNILNYLRLSHVTIGGNGFIAIANIIRNSTLKEIDLSYCSLGVQGAIEISKAFEDCKLLECLNLKHNKIQDEGIIYISKALIKNNFLSNNLYLDLSSNQIGDKGATLLGELLIKQLVWCVYLDNNNITNIGGNNIAKCLSKRIGGNNDPVFLMSLRSNENIGTKTIEMFRQLCNEKNITFFQFWVAFYESLPVCNPF